jgi:hypothetical protein
MTFWDLLCLPCAWLPGTRRQGMLGCKGQSDGVCEPAVMTTSMSWGAWSCGRGAQWRAVLPGEGKMEPPLDFHVPQI